MEIIYWETLVKVIFKFFYLNGSLFWVYFPKESHLVLHPSCVEVSNILIWGVQYETVCFLFLTIFSTSYDKLANCWCSFITSSSISYSPLTHIILPELFLKKLRASTQLAWFLKYNIMALNWTSLHKGWDSIFCQKTTKIYVGTVHRASLFLD